MGGETQGKLTLQKPADESTKQAIAIVDKQKEAPKANELTQFEKSVAEIERLLEVGDVKLPKVAGARQQQQTNNSNSQSSQTRAPQGVDLAADLTKDTAEISKQHLSLQKWASVFFC
jgi:hypothetical protein